jgi:hydrogenase 3 maturation protease
MPASLTVQLRALLAGARRIAILAVGSELHGDDRAGLIVAERLSKLLASLPMVEIFIGATAPENLTGEIKQYHPSHVILIDAAGLGAAPGAVEIIDFEEITGNSGSTHRLPLKVLVDYMRNSIGCRVAVIGIQPKSMEFGAPLSAEVRAAVGKLVRALTVVAQTFSNPPAQD